MIRLTRDRLAGAQHPDTKSDRVLLQEARDGQIESYELLHRRNSPVLYAFLHRRSGEPDLARCLTARAFAELGALVRDRRRQLPAVPLTWLLVTGGRLLLESERARGIRGGSRPRLAPVPADPAELGLAPGRGPPHAA